MCMCQILSGTDVAALHKSYTVTDNDNGYYFTFLFRTIVLVSSSQTFSANLLNLREDTLQKNGVKNK